MSKINKTEIINLFENEVLIQHKFFAYDTLVKWLYKNKIEELEFSTNVEKYVFKMNEDGILIYIFSITTCILIKKIFASFEEYLPEKNFYNSPLIL